MRWRRVVGAALACALAGAFALVVWPTPWRAIAVTHGPRGGPAGVLAAREHRLTGRVELLTVRGWRAIPTTSATSRTSATSAQSTTDPLADYSVGWRDTVR